MKRNSLFPLLKAQFLGFFGINKMLHSKKRHKNARLAGSAALVVFFFALFEAIFCFYIWAFATLFGEVGLTEYLIPIVFVITNMLILIFATISASGALFGFKDYEMVMSLPVKTWQVVLAKLLYIYITNLGFSLMIFVPALIFVSPYMAVTAGYCISTLIMAVFLPFLPMTFAVFLGTLFSFITSRMRHKNIIQIVLFLVFFLVMFFLPQILPDPETTESISLGAFGNFASLLTVFFGSVPYAAVYVVCTLVLFALPCLFLGKNFKKINTLLLTHKSRGNFKMAEVKPRGRFSALVVKEIKRLFSCPVYALNALISPFMVLAITVYAAISLGGMVSELSDYNTQSAFFVLAFLALISTVSPTTNCSISLEGKNLWILKSSPIPADMILYAKLTLNAIVNVPFCCITVIVAAVMLKLPVLFAVLLLISVALAAFAGGVTGLIVNLMFPVLNWENETVAVKRGSSTLFTMLINLAILIVIGVIAYFLLKISSYLALGAVFLLLAIAVIAGLYLLSGFGVKKFERLE